MLLCAERPGAATHEGFPCSFNGPPDALDSRPQGLSILSGVTYDVSVSPSIRGWGGEFFPEKDAGSASRPLFAANGKKSFCQVWKRSDSQKAGDRLSAA